MPSREIRCPRESPIPSVAGSPSGENFHKAKSVAIALFRIFFHPGTFSQGLDILMGKPGVILELRGVEINSITCPIGISFFFQDFDQRNLIVNRIGCFDPDIRLDDIQSARYRF